MTLDILVADDEALARARLVRMLARIPDVRVVAEAENGKDALDQSRAHHPQLLLLDVDMPGGDGFSVAEHAGAPLVVFITAHAQHAALAFEANAVDYLLKPVAQERLERALEKVRERLAVRAAAQSSPTPSSSEPLVVHEAGKVLFFDPRTVTRFHAEDKYSTFRADGREHLLRESLTTLEQRLTNAGFIRVHRAELVRLDAIRMLEPDSGGAVLHLCDGQRVSVSRRFLPAVKQALCLR